MMSFMASRGEPRLSRLPPPSSRVRASTPGGPRAALAAPLGDQRHRTSDLGAPTMPAMPMHPGLAVIPVCASLGACAGIPPAYAPLEPHRTSDERLDAEITRVRANQSWPILKPDLVLQPTVKLTARAPLSVETISLSGA